MFFCFFFSSLVNATASTLSIASQTSVVGSPKPEKRQANSPLPPPPVHLDALDSLDRSRKSMNVDEMYAKVMKKKGFLPIHSWQQIPAAAAAESATSKAQSHRGSVDLGFLVAVARESAESSYSENPSRRNSMDSTPPRVVSEANDHGQGEIKLRDEIDLGEFFSFEFFLFLDSS